MIFSIILVVLYYFIFILLKDGKLFYNHNDKKLFKKLLINMNIILLSALLFLSSFLGFTTFAYGQDVPKNVHLVYDVYNKNMHVVTIEADYQLNTEKYNVQTHFYSAGFASFFFHLNTHSNVNGIFKNNHVYPGLFTSKGYSRGTDRTAVIDFNYGKSITVKELTPPREENRDIIPETQIQNSIDMISAMTDLIYRVRTTGKCEDNFNFFDGVRLFSFRSWTGEIGEIPSTWTSPYRGSALLCNGVIKQTGGLKQSHNRAKMAKEQPGTLWFQNIDGIGLLPVRFQFLHPKVGTVIAILRHVKPPVREN